MTNFPSLHARNRISGMLLLYFACMLSSIPVFSQDTLYFDQHFETVKKRLDAKYFEVRFNDAVDVNKCAVLTYLADSSRQISMRRYSNYTEQIFHGKCMDWYPSGSIYREVRYDKGQKQGDEMIYYANGQLNRKLVWDHDTIVWGAFFKEDGTPKTELFQEDLDMDKVALQTPPSFPGGMDAWFQYLALNIHYPEKAKEENIQGKVSVSFVVERNGTVTDVRVTQTPSALLDKEAVRVVKKMPNWNPGRVNGVPVRVRYTLPINFKLE